ncbi:hypothetical protein ACIQC9_14055 [Brevundimonas sp. NPDC092305]|uniref:hypothetical protein n=1 Tax=Brevundimonas sp. NPDC092305 TaxID=3363957 RepID=UPI003828F819
MFMPKLARFTIAAAGLAGLCAIPTAASAADGSSIGFHLRAQVEPFCRIQSEVNEAMALSVVNGAVELGQVREVCNTRGGYSINVELLNVVGGDLEHGGETTTVDTGGKAKVVSGMARAKTSAWRLRNASLNVADAPVFMRVSISPL